MTFLTVSHISKQGLDDFKLQDISFTQRRNQKIAIAGETGSGKSTLLKIIAGLESSDSGEVLFDNEIVKGPSENLVPGHRDIAYLTQDFELPKFLRVEQVLAYSNNLSNTAATELFDICEISHLLERKTDELSGGEKQRIALTKLLITSPRLLLLDEPFSNLDMVHKYTLKKVLKRIYRQLKITCILVSHDPLDILSWADKIIVLKDGQVVQSGSSKKIYRKPVNEYVAGLFGNYNLITPQATGLCAVWGIQSKGKQVLIRPERLKISTKKRNAVAGKITEVNYFGPYYEIEIDLGETSVIVRTKKNTWAKGDNAYIACSPENIVYLL